MLDERAEVIRRFCLELQKLGLNPDRPFTAEFVPGRGWTFEADADDGPSSSQATVQEAPNVQTRPKVDPALRR